MKSESFEKLQAYLREIFQFDESDLDFGIYKILKLKRKEIERFIDGTDDGCLQPVVKKALSENLNDENQQNTTLVKKFLEDYVNRREREIILKDISSNIEKIKVLVENQRPDNAQSISQAIESIAANSSNSIIEDSIYNYILNFFELFYSNGDFGYNNRSIAHFKIKYDEDYNGSDTLFHWKHKDSYYIKTGNDFRNVIFELNGKRIEYRVEGFENTGSVTQNNNKSANLKHYKFTNIKFQKNNAIVTFILSDKTTPKTEVFSRILTDVFFKD